MQELQRMSPPVAWHLPKFTNETKLICPASRLDYNIIRYIKYIKIHKIYISDPEKGASLTCTDGSSKAHLRFGLRPHQSLGIGQVQCCVVAEGY